MTDNIFLPSEATPETKDFFAVVDAVYEDGATLKINDAVTEKRYVVATGVKLKAGDKVKVLKIDGTYVIEYAVSKAYTELEYVTESEMNDAINTAITGALAGAY